MYYPLHVDCHHDIITGPKSLDLGHAAGISVLSNCPSCLHDSFIIIRITASIMISVLFSLFSLYLIFIDTYHGLKYHIEEIRTVERNKVSLGNDSSGIR